jgi:hypothetical protein
MSADWPKQIEMRYCRNKENIVKGYWVQADNPISLVRKMGKMDLKSNEILWLMVNGHVQSKAAIATFIDWVERKKKEVTGIEEWKKAEQEAENRIEEHGIKP